MQLQVLSKQVTHPFSVIDWIGTMHPINQNGQLFWVMIQLSWDIHGLKKERLLVQLTTLECRSKMHRDGPTILKLLRFLQRLCLLRLTHRLWSKCQHQVLSSRSNGPHQITVAPLLLNTKFYFYLQTQLSTVCPCYVMEQMRR
jgi:hypothetical protein